MNTVFINVKTDKHDIRVEKVLDISDQSMLDWVAAQYAQINNAKVTIEDENGNILAQNG